MMRQRGSNTTSCSAGWCVMISRLVSAFPVAGRTRAGVAAYADPPRPAGGERRADHFRSIASVDTMNHEFQHCSDLDRLLRDASASAPEWAASVMRTVHGQMGRWVQFRIRTMLCAVAVVAVVFGWPEIHRHYIFWRLQGYTGSNLQELSTEEKQRIDNWILAITEEAAEVREFGPENWLLGRAKTATGNQRLIILQMEPSVTGGTSYCRLYSLESRATPLQSTRFGLSGYPTAAEFKRPREDTLHLIITTTSNWGDTYRETYAVMEHRVHFLNGETIEAADPFEIDKLFGTVELEDLARRTRFDVMAGAPVSCCAWLRGCRIQ